MLKFEQVVLGGAYECPECRQACLGNEAAYRCCSEVDAGVEDLEMAPA
jgi:hypothetical protein